MSLKISPSIVSADLGHLADALRQLAESGADRVHVDIEDGVFVPNMTFGFPVASAVRRLTRLPVELHLMTVEPEQFLSEWAQWGDRIAVHAEACPYPRRTLSLIRQYGREALLAFNPATALAPYAYLLDLLDGVLLMSSEPDAEGAPFIRATCERVRQARELFGGQVEITVDGGVGPETAPALLAAGADAVVVGRSLFSADDLSAQMQRLRGSALPT